MNKNMRELSTLFYYYFIGGFFGVFNSVVRMKKVNFFGGSFKHKILRAIISNILLIPSWLIQIYLHDIISGNIASSIIINEFFFVMVHFFLVFYIQFGIVPYFIMKPLGLCANNIELVYQFV